MKQLSFLPKIKISLEHGGNTRRGKRKIARPFSSKHPIHIVMRSSRAIREWSMLRPKHRDLIEKTLTRFALKYGIRIYRFANVGNHLHVVLMTQAKNRNLARIDLSSFLKEFAGEIARKITGARKAKPVGRFWDQLVYSRIVSWGREFESVMRYLVKNIFEAAGIWNRKNNPHWELISLKCGPPE